MLDHHDRGISPYFLSGLIRNTTLEIIKIAERTR
jgi:hypothetical protein